MHKMEGKRVGAAMAKLGPTPKARLRFPESRVTPGFAKERPESAEEFPRRHLGVLKLRRPFGVRHRKLTRVLTRLSDLKSFGGIVSTGMIRRIFLLGGNWFILNEPPPESSPQATCPPLACVELWPCSMTSHQNQQMSSQSDRWHFHRASKKRSVVDVT